MTLRPLRAIKTTASGGPLLVLMHGLGSNEQDLMSLTPLLSGDLTVVALRAPLPYGPGYSWFPVEWTDDGIQVDEPAALEAIATVAEELTLLKAEFRPSKLIVGGFSQGAMMTLGLILGHPDCVDAAVMLSGRPLPSVLALPELDDTKRIRCLVQHGLYDDVIEIGQGRKLDEALTDRKVPHIYEEYPMGHQISMESIESLNRWLANGILSPTAQG